MRLALGGLEEPSDLTLRLDYTLKHILIDEFQDTSVQLELLRNWYRAGFRETDVVLFGRRSHAIYL